MHDKRDECEELWGRVVSGDGEGNGIEEGWTRYRGDDGIMVEDDETWKE